MLEGSDAAEARAERAQPGTRATWVLVIPAAHRERDAVASGHHDAGRPDLDVELVHLAGRERLRLVVRVVRAVRQRQLRIELPV